MSTITTANGKPTDIALDLDLEQRITDGITALLAAEDLAGPEGDASIRVTVSRGVTATRGLLPIERLSATVVIQAWPVTAPPADHLERGLHLIVSAVRRDPANPLSALKTISRADYVYARFEARRAGADDALFLTVDDHISEATSANIFLVNGSHLLTPALACAILPGTTRTWLLRWGVEAGLTASEDWLRKEHLADADEAFLCSSVAGVLPVTRFEGQPIGDGRPGPWTLRAREAREAFIREASDREARGAER
jgi:branched-subunit amino acid aminotransferase/4-amino-4-deoxychorismate lyase